MYTWKTLFIVITLKLFCYHIVRADWQMGKSVFIINHVYKQDLFQNIVLHNNRHLVLAAVKSLPCLIYSVPLQLCHEP